MSDLPASLAGAAFLADPALAAVVRAIEAGGHRVRAVGGAVRNTLLGEPVADVDLCTDARPERVVELAAAAGLKPVPTGIEHGTVTVIARSKPFEVTTLRSDVETDGRRAVVAYTDDWAEDARRRDFTMNAVACDLDGTLHDPVGGLPDIAARRVRFIGVPDERIREDYLRILRFFRFFATYGHGRPDPEGLEACMRLQAGLDRLSRERIGQEMRKLVIAKGAPDTTAVMANAGILEHALGGQGWPDRLKRAFDLAKASGVELVPPLALAVLGAEMADDAVRLAERMRLSNAERDLIADVVNWGARLWADPVTQAVKEAVYRAGNTVVVGALIHSAARSGAALPATFGIAKDWAAPRFPITGADLVAQGMEPGPELGKRLRSLEEAWIRGGFEAG
ncbi:CCA tRNA nucleotidyltransferase [Chthonobacter albigriseus]|uniref:CCA tRNA nucleotidyltransferase n=1 Tax=Chthonobacter albigriseus TaxID=1683161 RepID=UPI0015EE7854|nr:CCA tRNA nucleotidyltransferase [Chthonobacter albigriseus]